MRPFFISALRRLSGFFVLTILALTGSSAMAAPLGWLALGRDNVGNFQYVNLDEVVKIYIGKPTASSPLTVQFFAVDNSGMHQSTVQTAIDAARKIATTAADWIDIPDAMSGHTYFRRNTIWAILFTKCGTKDCAKVSPRGGIGPGIVDDTTEFANLSNLIKKAPWILADDSAVTGKNYVNLAFVHVTSFTADCTSATLSLESTASLRVFNSGAIVQLQNVVGKCTP